MAGVNLRVKNYFLATEGTEDYGDDSFVKNLFNNVCITLFAILFSLQIL